MSQAVVAPRVADHHSGMNGLAARRPAILSITKLLLLAVWNLPFLTAAPVKRSTFGIFAGEPEPKEPEDPTLWIYLSVALALVLLGGAFAGLTIALMGQVSIDKMQLLEVCLTV